MKIVWTEPAVNDLDGIQLYLTHDSPRYASILIEKIILAAETLKLFPLMGRIVPEIAEITIREVFVHHYRIIYRAKVDLIEIVAIIHQARDLSKLTENL